MFAPVWSLVRAAQTVFSFQQPLSPPCRCALCFVPPFFLQKPARLTQKGVPTICVAVHSASVRRLFHAVCDSHRAVGASLLAAAAAVTPAQDAGFRSARAAGARHVALDANSRRGFGAWVQSLVALAGGMALHSLCARARYARVRRRADASDAAAGNLLFSNWSDAKGNLLNPVPARCGTLSKILQVCECTE